MSEESWSMTVPLDADGFLRRSCPHCEREFKWRPTDDAESTGSGGSALVEFYYCPYCYGSAAPSAWFTQEQVDYAQQIALAEVVAPQLRRLQDTIEDVNRPGGFIQAEVTMPTLAYPEPLTERNDMVRINVPCHPEEPIKVDEAWADEVACLVCGIRYPVELVRALPDLSGDV